MVKNKGPVHALKQAGEWVKIPLANGKGFAIIDAADKELVSQYRWRLGSGGYAITHVRRGKKQVTLYMHRLLLFGLTSNPKEVDHINHNKLDNQRANLRPATRAQNHRNKAIRPDRAFKGIEQQAGKWRARITVNGRLVYLGGGFDTNEGAAREYDRAAIRLHGEFAFLNFPKDTYTTTELAEWPEDEASRKAAAKARRTKTACKHGHTWDRVNTYRVRDGDRRCRACGRIQARRRRAQKRRSYTQAVPA
jgi:hypothetical protein